MTNLSSRTSRILIALFGTFIVVFGSTRLYPLLAGPSLTLSTSPYLETTGPTITVEGRVERISELSIAGLTVLPTEDGTFSRELFVQKGHTILQIVAKDRRGRSVTQEVHVYRTNEEMYGTQNQSENSETGESESGTPGDEPPEGGEELEGGSSTP
jgi:hypothetical protein